MPVKLRSSKRRDHAAECFAWSEVFDCGYDGFGDLPDIGISIDCNGRPDKEVAREAWNRLGACFVADKPHRARWAIKHFGVPTCR